MAEPINLQWPLRLGPKGAFATNDTTFEAIKDDLRILLQTNYGERPIHYDFGANLRPLIFEFRGEELRQTARDSIITAIEKWMPFVNIVNIDIDDETTDVTLRPNEVHIRLEFSVGNIDETRILTQRLIV
jgi:phage baseplate assembly protein W